MSSASAGMRIRVPATVVSRVVDDATVLLDTATGRYFSLDAVGSRVWSQLSVSPTVDAACEALLEDFDVDPKRLQADVHDLVERLAAAGLVEVSGPDR